MRLMDRLFHRSAPEPQAADHGMNRQSPIVASNEDAGVMTFTNKAVTFTGD